MRFVYILYASIAVAIIPIWEWASENSHSVRLLISSPSRVIEYIQAEHLILLDATKATFIEAAIGLVVGATVSLLLIIVCFRFNWFFRFILPAMVSTQVIPLIVFAPFFTIAFGIGLTSKIFMASVLCFFPIFVGFAQGYRLISQDTHNLLDVYEAPATYRIFKVYLPLSAPSGMAGLKVSSTLSVIGAIVAEFTGSERGLGRNLYLSTIRLDPDLMVSSVLASIILGVAMYGTVQILERRVGYWYLGKGGA